uniref:Protein kinase domain-containing protein n=1 Tax=Bicosoecida sp. CB-2014 TaxID=1486930 RepID=A0A7S1G8G8_9STRA
MEEGTSAFSEDGQIGEGGGGVVYAGILNGVAVAVKRCRKAMRRVPVEVRFLLSLPRHPCVVKLVAWSNDGDVPCVAYEHMAGGDLACRLASSSTLSMRDRLSIALDVALGLLDLHTESPTTHRWACHGDIKPSNILLDAHDRTLPAVHAKICDFGCARFLRRETARSLPRADGSHVYFVVTDRVGGTPNFMAPEAKERGYVSTAGDVYSFGILLMQLVTGQTHGSGEKLRTTLEAVDCNASAAHPLCDSSLDTTDSRVAAACAGLLSIALSCASAEFLRRPDMADVVLDLEAIIDEFEGNDAAHIDPVVAVLRREINVGRYFRWAEDDDIRGADEPSSFSLTDPAGFESAIRTDGWRPRRVTSIDSFTRMLGFYGFGRRVRPGGDIVFHHASFNKSSRSSDHLVVSTTRKTGASAMRDLRDSLTKRSGDDDAMLDGASESDEVDADERQRSRRLDVGIELVEATWVSPSCDGRPSSAESGVKLTHKDTANEAGAALILDALQAPSFSPFAADSRSDFKTVLTDAAESPKGRRAHSVLVRGAPLPLSLRPLIDNDDIVVAADGLSVFRLERPSTDFRAGYHRVTLEATFRSLADAYAAQECGLQLLGSDASATGFRSLADHELASVQFRAAITDTGATVCKVQIQLMFQPSLRTMQVFGVRLDPTAGVGRPFSFAIDARDTLYTPRSIQILPSRCGCDARFDDIEIRSTVVTADGVYNIPRVAGKLWSLVVEATYDAPAADVAMARAADGLLPFPVHVGTRGQHPASAWMKPPSTALGAKGVVSVKVVSGPTVVDGLGAVVRVQFEVVLGSQFKSECASAQTSYARSVRHSTVPSPQDCIFRIPLTCMTRTDGGSVLFCVLPHVSAAFFRVRGMLDDEHVMRAADGALRHHRAALMKAKDPSQRIRAESEQVELVDVCHDAGETLFAVKLSHKRNMLVGDCVAIANGVCSTLAATPVVAVGFGSKAVWQAEGKQFLHNVRMVRAHDPPAVTRSEVLQKPFPRPRHRVGFSSESFREVDKGAQMMWKLSLDDTPTPKLAVPPKLPVMSKDEPIVKRDALIKGGAGGGDDDLAKAQTAELDAADLPGLDEFIAMQNAMENWGPTFASNFVWPMGAPNREKSPLFEKRSRRRRRRGSVAGSSVLTSDSDVTNHRTGRRRRRGGVRSRCGSDASSAGTFGPGAGASLFTPALSEDGDVGSIPELLLDAADEDVAAEPEA